MMGSEREETRLHGNRRVEASSFENQIWLHIGSKHGDVEMNASVNIVSEGVGMLELSKELALGRPFISCAPTPRRACFSGGGVGGSTIFHHSARDLG